MKPVRSAGCGVALLLVLASAVRAQNQEPLRKTDLIRYLSGGTMTPLQIAQLVQRNCVTFTPTARDRQNLLALGADSTILAKIDACLRAKAATATPPAVAPAPTARPARPPDRPRPTPPPPTPSQPEVVEPPPPAKLEAVPLVTHVQVMVGGTAVINVSVKRGTAAVPNTQLVLRGSGRLTGGTDAVAVTDDRGIAQFRFPVGGSAGTVRLGIETLSGDSLSSPSSLELAMVAPLAPAGPPVAAPDRTGFVSGTGQRGHAGDAAATPLVFEVRDSAGHAIPGVAVSLSIVNGRLAGSPAADTTDANGQVSLQVTYGERAGAATTVTARVGAIERTAQLFPMPATPRQLVVLLDGNAVAGQVLFSKNRSAAFRIFCRDSYGNTVPVGGLKATSADERILRITVVTADSLGGIVSVTAVKSGLTNLLIEASGLRADFSASVH